MLERWKRRLKRRKKELKAGFEKRLKCKKSKAIPVTGCGGL
jgi:hypothetical protein